MLNANDKNTFRAQDGTEYSTFCMGIQLHTIREFHQDCINLFKHHRVADKDWRSSIVADRLEPSNETDSKQIMCSIFLKAGYIEK